MKENEKGREGEREGEREWRKMEFNDDDGVEGRGNTGTGTVDHRGAGLIQSEPRSPGGQPYLYSRPSYSVLFFPSFPVVEVVMDGHSASQHGDGGTILRTDSR